MPEYDILTDVKSLDERADARLIAERTLALHPDEPGAGAPRQRRFIVAVVCSLSVAAVAVLGLLLWWPHHRAGSASTGSDGGLVDQAPDPGVATGDAGFLNCNSWPSASVYVDGKRIPGSTPLTGVRLPAGTHTVALVSMGGSLRKEVQVIISPAKTRTIAVSLER